jgi:hypothetical protein
MKKTLSIATVLAALALSAVPAQAQLVNGNFNTGDLTGWWTYTPDAVNSSVSVLPGDAYSYDASPYAHQVNFGASANPQLGQDMNLTAGTQFLVSLAFRANNWGGAGVGIRYLDSSWAEVGWEFANIYAGNGTDTGWMAFSTPTWTAPANTEHVSMRLEAWTWSETYYDNVGVSVVPEPTAGALLGLGGLLMIRRWKTRARQ